MGISANDIRKGMVIVFDGQPCKVMEFHHHTPGKMRALVQARLRNMISGSSFEHRFRPNDTIEKAFLSQQEMEYLYSDGEMHYFMNTDNYEQITLSGDDLGDAAQWLMPSLKIEVEFYDGSPIGVKLPDSMVLVIEYTEPGLKGATVTNTNKPAKLENGVSISVPPFIESGEKIRVNPSEAKYIERVK